MPGNLRVEDVRAAFRAAGLEFDPAAEIRITGTGEGGVYVRALSTRGGAWSLTNGASIRTSRDAALCRTREDVDRFIEREVERACAPAGASAEG